MPGCHTLPSRIRGLSVRKQFLFLCLVLLVCGACAKEGAEKGYLAIFNGKDLSGWRTSSDKPGFRAADGCIYSEGGELLYTESEYGNYILRFEWMLSKVGNSGVLIRSEPENAWETGFEVQLLAPWTPYRDDLHCTASIYGHVAVTNRPDETTGRWHSMEIVCDRLDIIIAVDGKICTWGNIDRVESLKDKHLRGHIALQGNHSDPDQWVKFRNLRIRDLDRETNYLITGFRNADPRIQRTTHQAAVRLGPVMVGPLCSLIMEEDSIGSGPAKKTLFDIAALASDPEAPESRRQSVEKALQEQLSMQNSEIMHDYLVWLLGMLGG